MKLMIELITAFIIAYVVPILVYLQVTTLFIAIDFLIGCMAALWLRERFELRKFFNILIKPTVFGLVLVALHVINKELSLPEVSVGETLKLSIVGLFNTMILLREMRSIDGNVKKLFGFSIFEILGEYFPLLGKLAIDKTSNTNVILFLLVLTLFSSSCKQKIDYAAECAKRFSVKQDTLRITSEVIRFDTLPAELIEKTVTVRVPCPVTNAANSDTLWVEKQVSVPCPPQKTIVKTVFKTDSIVVQHENVARVALLTRHVDSLRMENTIKEYQKSRLHKQNIVLLSALLLLLLAAIILYFIKKK